MINTLRTATGGYLKRTAKAALVIAVSGYLNFNNVPPPPPSNSGGGGDYNKYNQKHKEAQEQRLRDDDDLVFNIIKIWVQTCQT